MRYCGNWNHRTPPTAHHTGAPLTHPKRAFALSLATFLAIWGIYLLVLYPGILSVDSIDVIRESLGIQEWEAHFRYDGTNNHHPYVYVAVTGTIFRLGMAIGLTEPMCVALVALTHLIILALCCAFAISRIYELSGSKLLFALSWMFVAFNPVLAQYSVTLWKDIPFSAFLIVFAAEIATISYRSRKRSLRPHESTASQQETTGTTVQRFSALCLGKGDFFLFMLSGILCALLRSNGLAVVALSLVVAVVLLPSLRNRAFIALTSGMLILPILITGPIYNALGVQPSHFSEALSIPLQQVACTISEEGTLTGEQEELLGQILPLEKWGESYNPASPNPIKFNTEFNDNYLEAHKAEFVAVWLQAGLQNPSSYARAWVAQTSSFWSISGTTWYTVNAGYGEGLDHNNNTLVVHNLLSGIVDEANVKYAQSLATSIFEPLFNIGALVWSMLFTLLYLAITKQWRKITCIVPALAVWVCFLLAAPSNDFRYMLALHLYVPLLMLLLFHPETPDECNEQALYSKPCKTPHKHMAL